MARLDSFRTSRWLRTFNLVLQALLFFTFFAGLNYLARNHPLRFDLTAHRRYSLSPETLAWVQNLPSPVRIVATFPSDGDNPLVSGLLSEYAHATESNPNGRITVEYLDVDLNRRTAEELGVDQPNAIVLLCRDRREVLTVDSLYALKEQKRAAFQGEQKLTSAILDVSARAWFGFSIASRHSVVTEPAARLSNSACRSLNRLRMSSRNCCQTSAAIAAPSGAIVMGKGASAAQNPISRAPERLARSTAILVIGPIGPSISTFSRMDL